MKKFIILLFSLVFHLSTLYAQNSEPTISTVNGKQDVCINRPNFILEVKINFPPGFNKEIETFNISWWSEVDGVKRDTTIKGSLNPKNLKLDFKLGGFYKSCKSETEGTVRLDTYLKGVEKPLNNAFFPLFINPPTAKINAKNKVCLSEPLVLNGLESCPSDGVSKYTWKIEGKEVSNESTFSHQFEKAGEYTVALTVENQCGKDSVTKKVNVYDDPIAIAKVDSGAVGVGPFRVCLDENNEAFVKLNGSDSKNANEFLWNHSSTNSSVRFWYGKEKKKSGIKFTKEGEFTVDLIAWDPCDIPDTTWLNFIVGKADVIQLNQIQSGCNPINYTPSPYFPDAKYFINGVLESKFPVYLDYGEYKIKGVLTNECGETSDSIEVKIVQAVDTEILSPSTDITVCQNSDPIPIDVNVDKGSFNSSMVKFDEEKNQYFFHPSTAGKHEVIYSTGFNECKRQDKVVIHVMEGLNLELNHQNDVCAPFNYMPSPYNIDAEYFVNGEEIISFPHTITESGLVRIETHLKNDCEDLIEKDSFNVISNEELEIIMEGATEVCVNSDPILLQYSLSGATFSGSYLIVENGETYFNPQLEGQYTIKLNLPLQGCSQSDEIVFEVLGVSTETKDINVCIGTEGVELEATPAGGTWTSSTCQECISGSYFDLTKTKETKINVVYSFSNDIGCSSESQAFINVIEPKSEFQLSSPPCGTGIEFNTDGSVGDNLIWLVNDKVVGNPPFIGLTTGEHIITMVAKTGECFDTSSVAVFIIDPVENSSDFELLHDEHCTPYTLNPQVASPYYDYLDYKWTIIYDGDTTEVNDYNLGNDIELINDDPYRKIALVTFASGNVCGMEETVDSMEIIGIPRAVIGVDSSRYGCSPYTIALSNIALGEMDNCIWRVDGKTITSCDPYIYHTFVAKDTVTQFPIELEVSNDCGSHIAYDTITVTPPWIDVFFNTNEYEVCPNTPIYFEDATTPAPIYWRWSFGDGQFSDEQHPTIQFSQAGTYYVTLKASTGCGYDSITRPIVVKNAPEVDFILPVYACQNQVSDTIVNLSNYTEHKFVWDFGNGIKDSVRANPTPVFEDFGVHQVALTMTDNASGCSSTLSKSYEINAQPQIDILLDSIICYGKELRIPNNTLYANDYTWYYDQVAVHKGEDPLIIFRETGEHYIQLVATYNEKCVDSISKVVFVKRCDVYIPNLFTPNNDGKDDFFTAFGGVNTSLIRSMKIFDRWGDVVFSKENFPLNVEYMGWDGSVNTRSKSYGLSSTVFVYMIEIEFTDGTTEIFSGDVTLLR